MNFLINLFIENSLNLMIFSMIDLRQHNLSTFPNNVSYLFAMVYITTLTGISIGNIYQVYKKENNTFEILYKATQTYPQINALFFQLKIKKSALIFKSVFILRTMCIALVFIVLQDYQLFQLIMQVAITLIHLMYLIKSRPFEIPILNILEILNEITILSIQYYCIVFSDVLHFDS